MGCEHRTTAPNTAVVERRINGDDVAFSPDGRTIAGTSVYSEIYLWDANTGQLLRTLTRHTPLGVVGRVVAFSPDSRTIASDSIIGEVDLWDVNTRKHNRTLISGFDTTALRYVESVNFASFPIFYVSSVSFYPDRCLEQHKGEHPMKYRLFSILVLFITLAIATSSFTQVSQTKNFSGGRNAGTGNDIPGIFDIRYSPDGKRLAVVIMTGILLFNTQTDDKPEVFTEDIGRSWRVAFSSDGKTLVSVNSFGTIQMRDSKTKEHMRTLNNFPPQWSRTITFSPDGRTIAYTNDDKTVSLWDAKTERHLQTFKGHSDHVKVIAFSSDSKRVATGSYDNTVRLWDVNMGKHLQILSGHSDSVESIAFSPDGASILSGDMRNTIRLWNAKTGKLIRTLSDLRSEDTWMGGVTSVAFSPDGKLIAGAGPFNSHLWDAKTGEHLQILS